MNLRWRWMVGTIVLAGSAVAQSDLQQQIRASAAEAKGKVSVACSLPGTALDCAFNPSARPPMQSVFKLPLAITVLSWVEQGKLDLDQPIRMLPADLIPHAYSPLQDKYPAGGVEVPLRELLRLSVSLSDNVAADMLLRLVGGPQAVESYVRGIGIAGFQLKDNEAALNRAEETQYRNWFEPQAAVALLRRMNDRSPLNAAHTALLMSWMQSVPGRPARLEARLPNGVKVLHKTGTSGVSAAGLAFATNDIGLIALPDGRRLAVAVFVTDAMADAPTRDKVIGEIARQIYEAALSKQPKAR